jgi:hypothetical protein
MSFEHQAYPSVRYHRAGTTKTVHHEGEDSALMAEGDWADTPAAFDACAAEDAPAAEDAVVAEDKPKPKRK